jgi:hypothetical protein
MKHLFNLLTTIALALVAVLTLAPVVMAGDHVTVPEPTPIEKAGFMLNLANGLVSLPFGTVLVPLATLTGQQKGLCEGLLGGKYTPEASMGNVCPGGVWLRLVGYKEK